MEEQDRLLTTPEVAERLGVTTRRVLALIQAGRLPSQQFGRDHVIKESDLALVSERKSGRPKKQATDSETSKTAKKSKGKSAVEAPKVKVK